MFKLNNPKGNPKHPILVNLLIIILIAFIGLWIVYFASAVFTRHGEEQVVPKVENMSYTKAVELLHSYGLNAEIRDSLFRDDVKPGYVIEQFPKAQSIVKPGRKVFLYINAVHPKEVIIDDHHDRTQLAMKGISYRQGLARLTELGFKNLETMVVLGDNDRIVRILANGKPVYQMQKVPVTAKITIVVNDGRLGLVRDSLFDIQQIGYYMGQPSYFDDGNDYAPTEQTSEEAEYFEMPPEEQSISGQGQTEEENVEYF